MDEKNTRGTPVVTFPDPEDNVDLASKPVTLLPNEGEGGPVDSNFFYPPYPSTPSTPTRPGVSVTPGITVTPGSSGEASVRFFNASFGYPAFNVYVDGNRVVTSLQEHAVSSYVRLYSGRRLISIRSSSGYIYLQSYINFPASGMSTVSVVNRAGGLSLVRITDSCRM